MARSTQSGPLLCTRNGERGFKTHLRLHRVGKEQLQPMPEHKDQEKWANKLHLMLVFCTISDSKGLTAVYGFSVEGACFVHHTKEYSSHQ